jgi:SRSO17 transposase
LGGSTPAQQARSPLPERRVRGLCVTAWPAFIERALYLPKRWMDDPAGMATAHVPPGTSFATKPAMALGMMERAIAARRPFGW